MAADTDEQTVPLVVDVRPVVWEATMVTPASDADVTVVVRVTYRTLVEICDDLFGTTESAAVRANYRERRLPGLRRGRDGFPLLAILFRELTAQRLADERLRQRIAELDL